MKLKYWKPLIWNFLPHWNYFRWIGTISPGYSIWYVNCQQSQCDLLNWSFAGQGGSRWDSACGVWGRLGVLATPAAISWCYILPQYGPPLSFPRPLHAGRHRWYIRCSERYPNDGRWCHSEYFAWAVFSGFSEIQSIQLVYKRKYTNCEKVCISVMLNSSKIFIFSLLTYETLHFKSKVWKELWNVLLLNTVIKSHI